MPVDRVALFDEGAVTRSLHFDVVHVDLAAAQRGVEGKGKRAARDDLATRHAVRVRPGVLDEAIPADVVRRPVGANDRHILVRAHALLAAEQGIEGYDRAALAVAEDANAASQLVRKRVAGRRVGCDGQADRGRPRGVGGAVDSPAVPGSQRPPHGGKLRPAADDVEAGDVVRELRRAALVLGQKRLHRGEGRLDERSDQIVEFLDRNRRGGGGARNVHGDVSGLRVQGLLGLTGRVEEPLPFVRGEFAASGLF